MLILTKPLGTGTLLAANRQGQAQGRWVENAIGHMLVSNRQAADVFYQYQATACTDITGPGLLGHLLDMLSAAGTGASLQLDQLPMLDGAIDCAANGCLSALQSANRHRTRHLVNNQAYLQHPHYPLLFDPQTSGGLLAAVPATTASACLNTLRQRGYGQAAIIGAVDPQQAAAMVLLS